MGTKLGSYEMSLRGTSQTSKSQKITLLAFVDVTLNPTMVPLILITSCSFIILALNHQARALAFTRHVRSSPRSPPRPPSSFSPAARSWRRRPRVLLGSSRDDGAADDDDGNIERRRGGTAFFRDVEVAGVSVSPFGFLALLRSSSLAAVPDRRVGGIIGDDGGGDGATMALERIKLATTTMRLETEPATA